MYRIMAIHIIIRLLYVDFLPEAICFCHFVVAMAMGGMCVQSITAIRTIISNYRLLCTYVGNGVL